MILGDETTWGLFIKRHVDNYGFLSEFLVLPFCYCAIRMTHEVKKSKKKDFIAVTALVIKRRKRKQVK